MKISNKQIHFTYPEDIIDLFNFFIGSVCYSSKLFLQTFCILIFILLHQLPIIIFYFVCWNMKWMPPKLVYQGRLNIRNTNNSEYDCWNNKFQLLKLNSLNGFFVFIKIINFILVQILKLFYLNWIVKYNSMWTLIISYVSILLCNVIGDFIEH